MKTGKEQRECMKWPRNRGNVENRKVIKEIAKDRKWQKPV